MQKKVYISENWEQLKDEIKRRFRIPTEWQQWPDFNPLDLQEIDGYHEIFAFFQKQLFLSRLHYQFLKNYTTNQFIFKPLWNTPNLSQPRWGSKKWKKALKAIFQVRTLMSYQKRKKMLPPLFWNLDPFIAVTNHQNNFTFFAIYNTKNEIIQKNIEHHPSLFLKKEEDPAIRKQIRSLEAELDDLFFELKNFNNL